MITSEQNRQVRFIYRTEEAEEPRGSGMLFSGRSAGRRRSHSQRRGGAGRLFVSESFLNSASFGKIKELYSSAYRKTLELVLLPVSDKLFAAMGDIHDPSGDRRGDRFSRDRSCGDGLRPGKITASSARYGLLVLENLQDPGNIGTIIRTAAAAGMAGILCTKGTVDIYNSKVLRSTAGAIFRLPLCRPGRTALPWQPICGAAAFRCAPPTREGERNYFSRVLPGIQLS